MTENNLLTDRFNAIIEKDKEEDLLAFLRTLTPDEKKAMTPGIKRLNKHFSAFGPISHNTHGHIHGTKNQREMMQLTSFVCLNRPDYDKSPWSVWMLEKQRLQKIIDWYCPSWFSDFVNQQASLDFVPNYLNYDWIMELTEKGVLQPSKELLVKIMPEMIFEKGATNYYQYIPANLLKHAITLQEHIWYLFEFESNLHYSDRYLRFETTDPKVQRDWTGLFKRYTSENRIDRFRVLKESLLASNRNFNKVLSGWFANLFTELDPTKEEIVQLQKELVSVLSSPHSKPVNTALQHLKTILSEKDFEASSFLDSIPVLLSSDTKATNLATVTILDKIAQKHPAYRERIALQTCQCFITQDDAIQSKAAALIAKYGEPTAPALRTEIAAFYPSMLTKTRQSLTGFLDTPVESESHQTGQPPISEPNFTLPALTPIVFPETIDDLVFLASQAFDNNEPWHTDILAAALVHFRNQLNDEDLPLFTPAFQRAFGLLKNGLRSQNGYLDDLLAYFFIDVGNALIHDFQSAGKDLVALYRTYDSNNAVKKTSYLVIPELGSYTARWNARNKIEFYQPYKDLLLGALEKIRERSPLPLLSTPTHLPCWIDPLILIERLHLYQEAGKPPTDMDLQVAISRCKLPIQPGAAEKADQSLSGELGSLMTFLLTPNAAPQKPVNYKAAWWVAALTKKNKEPWPAFDSLSYSRKSLNNYTGQLHWLSVAESYVSKQFDYQTRKHIESPAVRKILSVHRDHTETKVTGLQKLLLKVLPATKGDPPMLYEFLHYTQEYLVVEYNDIKRILSLIPNNPEPILADTVNECLECPEFSEEGSKRMVTAVAQTLYEIWTDPGEMAKLFLGTCLLSSDKTIINIAGEIWLKAVSTRAIDNKALGKTIGIHERIEFAPLKRFTDLATQTLMRVSALHNRELQTLIEHILVELPDEPIKNLKKLLEIYSELLSANKSSIILPAVAGRLNAWEKNNSLHKLVGYITSTFS